MGTSEGVTSVPVARCSIYATCAQCVLARDPLCGWSRAGAVCTGLEGHRQDLYVKRLKTHGEVRGNPLLSAPHLLPVL